MPGHDIIVIGASAGGVDARMPIAHGLPADLPAAIFIVLHVPPNSPSLLPTILNRMCALHASHTRDGETIEPGRIYTAAVAYDHRVVGVVLSGNLDDGTAGRAAIKTRRRRRCRGSGGCALPRYAEQRDGACPGRLCRTARRAARAAHPTRFSLRSRKSWKPRCGPRWRWTPTPSSTRRQRATIARVATVGQVTRTMQRNSD